MPSGADPDGDPPFVTVGKNPRATTEAGADAAMSVGLKERAQAANTTTTATAARPLTALTAVSERRRRR